MAPLSLIAGSQEEAAETLGINTRTFARWLKRGCPGEPRNYVIRDIIAWAKANAWTPEEPASEEPKEDFGALLDAEKYREKKRQNDEADNLLAQVEELERALEVGVTAMLPILDALPLDLKRYWPEITGDQIQHVKKAVAECRNALADLEVDLDG